VRAPGPLTRGRGRGGIGRGGLGGLAGLGGLGRGGLGAKKLESAEEKNEEEKAEGKNEEEKAEEKNDSAPMENHQPKAIIPDFIKVKNQDDSEIKEYFGTKYHIKSTWLLFSQTYV
jgi:hypothetical protein